MFEMTIKFRAAIIILVTALVSITGIAVFNQQVSADPTVTPAPPSTAPISPEPGNPDVGDDDGSGGDGAPTPPGNPQPVRKNTYCDDVNRNERREAEENGEPFVKYQPDGKALDLFKYPDGRFDSVHRVPRVKFVTIVVAPGIWVIFPILVIDSETRIIEDGGAPTHQKYRVWCTNDGNKSTATRKKVKEIWLAMASAASVEQAGRLFAKVVDRLDRPTVEFKDADQEHGWLWVNVEHHIGITRPRSIRQELRRTNGWGDTAHAWVAAEPTSVEIVVQDASGEKLLGSCNLERATSATGCPIKFTHASSVDSNGKFYGLVRVSWKVTSNSGKYQDLDPFVTARGFSFEVAEAMAVSN